MQGFSNWHIVEQLSKVVGYCQSWKRVIQLITIAVLLELPIEGWGSTGQGINEEAERVMKNVKESKYSHELFIDEKIGVYEMDCSLFVGCVLSKTVPEALESVPIESEVGRPRAGSFFQAIYDEMDGWRRIRNLMNASAGDIIAWREKVYDPGSNSGHVMIVASCPKKIVDGRVEVEVFDAARVPHAKDSRRLGSYGGVGKGILWFEVNAQGEPIGYYWSERMRRPRYKEIVVGRVVYAQHFKFPRCCTSG